MICSLLPLGALLSAAAASRMSFSFSFDASPAAQRLLQCVIDAGIGLFARQVPLENSKKSLQGSALRSRSLTSMPCKEEFWAKEGCIKRSKEESNTSNDDSLRMWPFSTKDRITCDPGAAAILDEVLGGSQVLPGDSGSERLPAVKKFVGRIGITTGCFMPSLCPGR